MTENKLDEELLFIISIANTAVEN